MFNYMFNYSRSYTLAIVSKIFRVYISTLIFFPFFSFLPQFMQPWVPSCPAFITWAHLFNTKLVTDDSLGSSPRDEDAEADRTITDLCHLNAFQCTSDLDCRHSNRICCNVHRRAGDFTEDFPEEGGEGQTTEATPLFQENAEGRWCKICIFPH